MKFDHVIIGGGTAGCVLANRLTEDAGRTVLLLEAGGEDKGFWLSIPAGFGKLLVNERFNWRFWTEPEDNVCQRRIVVPRGKGLGGSSLINGMIFVRGQPEDFDHWAQLGNKAGASATCCPTSANSRSSRTARPICAAARDRSTSCVSGNGRRCPRPSSRPPGRPASGRTRTITGPSRTVSAITRSTSRTAGAGARPRPI